MTVKISIYDFFANTIPGAFYLTTIAYVCSSFGLIAIDFQALSGFSLIQALVIAVAAYILGIIIDPIAGLWYRLFKPKNISSVVLEEFRSSHSNLCLKFQDKDWPVLLAYLRRVNAGAVDNIERFNATNIMMRNISFDFAILSLVEVIQFFRTASLWHLVLGLALIAASVISIQRAVKFARWFYLANYEAVLAQGLESSDLLTRESEKSTTPRGTEGSIKN